MESKYLWFILTLVFFLIVLRIQPQVFLVIFIQMDVSRKSTLLCQLIETAIGLGMKYST